MLLEIVIVGCLNANPSFCEDFRVPVEAEQSLRLAMNPVLCTKLTTGVLEAWEKQHSTYFVKRWTCTPVVPNPKVTL